MSNSVWSSAELDLDAYLERIGYEGSPRADLETLREIHRRHIAAIPFENLEVMLGRPVLLDIKALQDKMVAKRRGGYCYEQNSLLAAVLEHVGFSFRGLGARVRAGAERLRAVTHMALAVEIDGEEWLCDVGFGGEGLLEPILFRPGVEARQGEWTFGIGQEQKDVRVLRSLHPEGWWDIYAIGPEDRFPIDYVLMNHYTSTHPRSPFIARAVVQQAEPTLRRTLVGSTFVNVRADGSTEQREVGPEELSAMLRSEFRIDLDDEEAATLARVYRSRT